MSGLRASPSTRLLAHFGKAQICRAGFVYLPVQRVRVSREFSAGPRGTKRHAVLGLVLHLAHPVCGASPGSWQWHGSNLHMPAKTWFTLKAASPSARESAPALRCFVEPLDPGVQRHARRRGDRNARPSGRRPASVRTRDMAARLPIG